MTAIGQAESVRLFLDRAELEGHYTLAHREGFHWATALLGAALSLDLLSAGDRLGAGDVARDSLTPTELGRRPRGRGPLQPRRRGPPVHGPGDRQAHRAHVYAKLGVSNRTELATDSASRSTS